MGTDLWTRVQKRSFSANKRVLTRILVLQGTIFYKHLSFGGGKKVIPFKKKDEGQVIR